MACISLARLRHSNSSPYSRPSSGIDSYLSYLWSPGEATPVNEVRKLGPGEAMWVAQGDIQEHLTWYRLPIVHLPNRSAPQISEEQAIRGTEQHLRQAVHRQLVSDVPVGAFPFWRARFQQRCGIRA